MLRSTTANFIYGTSMPVEMEAVDVSEKAVLIIAVVAILGTAGVYVAQYTITPEKISLSELSNHIGEYVHLRALVLYYHNTTNGMLLKIADTNFTSDAYAYLEFRTSIAPGCTVDLEGYVQNYRGSPEVIVRDKKDIIVVSKSLKLTLQILLKNPDYYRGLLITVKGKITHSKELVNRSQIEITDGINTAWLYVPGGYSGENRAYFYGFVKNGTLRVDKVSLSYKDIAENISIAKIPQYEGKYICVYGKVLRYRRFYGYLYWLSSGNYTLKCFSRTAIQSDGYCTLTGFFKYDEHYGTYTLFVKEQH